MNELKNYIEIGEKKAGKQIELAKTLGITDVNLRMAKAGNRGLPDAVCIELAEYIEVNPIEIIAASNLVTEKDERRKKVFEKYLKKNSRAVANWVIAAIVISILTLSPLKPAQAKDSNTNKMYIMLNHVLRIVENASAGNLIFYQI